MFKTALFGLILIGLLAICFWLIFPGLSPNFISNQKTSASPSPTIADVTSQLDILQNKINVLESSNSALISRVAELESDGAPSTVVVQSSSVSPNKTPALIPINPGGTVDSTTWTPLTSGSITIDPANYPGYKNAYLIINLSVYQGQGTAYAQLVNTANTLAITPSTVSTSSFSPVSLTSQGFQLPAGSNTYTVQLYTQVGGYPAQAADSFLQITY